MFAIACHTRAERHFQNNFPPKRDERTGKMGPENPYYPKFHPSKNDIKK
jgi:hypothetical protein